MAIEAGSEWIHVETLTPVTVIRQFSNSLSLMVQAPVGPMFEVTEARFESDYARNEPVTLELLERMGWECENLCDSCSRARLTLSDGNGRLLWNDDGNLSHMAADNWSIATLKSAPMLRDLLNVLRVFGVETLGNTLAPPR